LSWKYSRVPNLFSTLFKLGSILWNRSVKFKFVIWPIKSLKYLKPNNIVRNT
jgi:hypothetical protein